MHYLENFKKTPVTIYRKNEFFGDVEKLEVKLISVESKKYAQYENAFKYSFIAKGKRKEQSEFLRGSNCFLKIVSGWGHISPAETMTEKSQDLKKSKYLSFDPRYVSDFETLFSSYLLENVETKVLFNFSNYDAR